MKQYLPKDITLRENANPKLYITLHIKQSTVCNPDNLQINVWTVNKSVEFLVVILALTIATRG